LAWLEGVTRSGGEWEIPGEGRGSRARDGGCKCSSCEVVGQWSFDSGGAEGMVKGSEV